MAREKKKRKRPPRAMAEVPPAESRAAEAMTVAWTVSVTSLFFCDVAIIAIKYLTDGGQQATKLSMFGNLLLVAGALAGVLSLALLGVVCRVRTVPPPPALIVFGGLVALAPILTFVFRLLL